MPDEPSPEPERFEPLVQGRWYCPRCGVVATVHRAVDAVVECIYCDTVCECVWEEC